MRRVTRLEWVAAALLAAGSAWLHLLHALAAGPLWRDEVNTVRIATLPTLSELAGHLRFDSYPVLWFLALRGWVACGWDTDAGLRVLGLLVGLAALAAAWFCARSLGSRVPLFTLAILGGNVTLVVWGDSLRAWSFGVVLILAATTLLFRAACDPTRANVAAAAALAVASVHALYYNSILLFASCLAGAAVAWDRRRARAAATLLGIGVAAAVSLLPYLPVVRRVRDAQILLELPGLSTGWFLGKLAETLGSSSAWLAPLWAVVVAAVTSTALVALVSLRADPMEARRPDAAAPRERDVLWFGCITVGASFAGYFLFLGRLKYATNPWYYLPLVALVTVAADALLSATVKKRRWIPLALALLAGAGYIPAAGKVGLRHTNLDRVAARLEADAAAGDLVVVSPWFFGVTMERYYRGAAPWTTLPPLSSSAVHRYDLVKRHMMNPDPAAVIEPVLDRMGQTLRAGRTVWVAGRLESRPPEEFVEFPPPPPHPVFGWNSDPYLHAWSVRTGQFLLAHSTSIEPVDVSVPLPVSRFEEGQLLAVRGWR
jgi:hypothetical protein